MTLPKVSEIARAQLQQLGAIIHDITHISYPFDDVKYEPGINKQCRYSKLHIFNMTSYDKVVYLDADTMAIENIDELFALPAFSAVKDMGGAFNTGMMVIQPSTDVFERMLETHKGAPSYNKGDQGFINWFFNFTSAAIVPTHFNVVAKLNVGNLIPNEMQLTIGIRSRSANRRKRQGLSLHLGNQTMELSPIPPQRLET